MDIGWQELLVILVIVVVVFGAGKLPEAARSLGQGVREFRKEVEAPDRPATATSTSTSSTGTVADRVNRAANVAAQVRAEDV